MIRPHLWLRASLLALLGASVVPAAGCGGDVSTEEICSVHGKTYKAGETFKDSDGCNTCTCAADASVQCTLLACVGPDCSYDGETHHSGESFPAGDGCNTCTCQDDGTVGCTELGCSITCTYNGTTYLPGDSFPATDSCGTCSCDDEGKVTCTTPPCPKDPGCVYAGKSYGEGAQYPAIDGCNTCQCENGASVCTKVACQCNPDKEWWRKYVSTDPKQCEVIDYGCPMNTTGFQNDCGCGCEEDPSCPQYFDCEPPNSCDMMTLEQQCPYSGFAF